MRPFDDIYATAFLHKGSVAAVEADLPRSLSAAELRRLEDDRYLSEMSRRIFRAGLKHSMVDSKWPAFERAFMGFDPFRVAMMSDETLESLMQDKSIIRHFGKIKAVRSNASWMLNVINDFGSFAEMIAAWPSESIVDLWLLMKRQGSQLGGQSAPRFLRMVGKDTFILTPDVVSVLRAEGVVAKPPSGKRELQLVQVAFNRWSEESGRSLAQVSRILSYTANA